LIVPEFIQSRFKCVSGVSRCATDYSSDDAPSI